MDLALHAIFVRWLSLRTDDHATGEAMWREVADASPAEEQSRRFMTMAIFIREFRESASPRPDPAVVAKLVHALDRPLPTEGHGATAVLAEAFEVVLDALDALGDQAGEAETPDELAHLMASLTVRPGDHVLDPACGIGTSLLAASRAARDVRVTGYEINLRTSHRAQMRLLVHDVATEFIAAEDAFSLHNPGAVDVVLAQPPWGITLEPEQEDLVRSLMLKWGLQESGRPGSDLAWLLLCLDALRGPSGRAAVLLPAGSTRPGRLKGASDLVHHGLVEAIITLPPGLFAHTRIPAALWLLRSPGSLPASETVLMVDASSLVTRTPAGRVRLDTSAVQQLTDLVVAHRSGVLGDAAPHLARVLRLEELDGSVSLDPRAHLADPPETPVVHPAPVRTLLTAIGLTNFKAFSSPATAPLAPLTLVYGPNSAGKSSIIQALLLLKQSRDEGHLVTQGALVNVGGFRGLVHGHRDADMQLSFSYGTLPHWIAPSDGPDPSMPRHVQWTFAADAAGHGTPVCTEVSFAEHALRFERAPGPLEPYSLDLNDLTKVFEALASGTLSYPPEDLRGRTGGQSTDEERARARNRHAQRALRDLKRSRDGVLVVRQAGLLPSGELLSRPRELSYYVPADNVATRYATRTMALAGAVAGEVSHLLDELVWLGPLRSAPKRVYDRATSARTAGDGADVAIYLFDHTTVVDQVNDWLERLEVPYTLQVLPVAVAEAAHLVGDLVAISLTDTRTGVQVTPADVGYGVSQVLPIVVELLARRESVIAIEQPETHLHPRLQARLADLFIDSVQAGGRANQLIVETHSEHLMLRVQRRIREGTLDPAGVSVLYVDRTSDGPAGITCLRLSEQGDFLDEWPDGFFDDRLTELFPGL